MSAGFSIALRLFGSNAWIWITANALSTTCNRARSAEFTAAVLLPLPGSRIVIAQMYGAQPATYPLANSKGKDLWMTEFLDLDTSWPFVLATGRQIHDCMVAGMNAYVWWYIVRFYGPILEDGTVSKRGFVMLQYARFVRPGYARVNATPNPQMNVYVTAYANSSTVVLVAVNTGASIQQAFSIHNGSVNTVSPYVTSSSKNCVPGSIIAVSGGQFTASLDSSSVTTFVSD